MERDQNLPENLEKIIDRKVEQRTQKLEEKLNKIEKENDSRQKEDSSNSALNLDRRDFLKKAGLGTLGLGALLSPVSSLTVKDSGFDVFTGSSGGDLTNYLSVGQGGPVNIQNTSLELNNQNINGVNQLNGQDADSLSSEGIPSGVITMWSGTTSDVPSGWTLCDGSDGTPDLTNRFIVGSGGSYSTGDTGGSNQVQLSVDEMPSHGHTGSTDTSGSHSHGVRNDGSNYGTGTNLFSGWSSNYNDTADRSVQFTYSYGGGDALTEDGSHSHNISINSSGNDQSHENRPPYYALAFIMKI